MIRRFAPLPALWILALASIPSEVAGQTPDATAQTPQAAAQTTDFPEIRVGQSLEGFLGTGGPSLAERGPFTVYRFEAEAGTRYGVDLRSWDFDSYLILARPVGGITDILRENDDAAGESDSRLRFEVDQAGTYLLIVQSYEPRTGGTFTLSLEERQLPPPRPAEPLVLGEPVTGMLSDDSSILLSYDEEIPYDLWAIEGTGGRPVMISLDSDDFDAYLEFGPMSGEEMIVTHSDDDGGDDLNALLRIELPHDGRFGVRVRPAFEGAEGGYSLRAETFTPAPVLRRPIDAGVGAEGVFTFEDPVLDGGIHFQEWAYDGEAGERIRITMRSTDVDSFLLLGQEGTNGEFDQLTFNDDGPDGGLDSQIDYTLPEPGTYLIRARTYSAGQRGAYSIDVERVP